MKISDLKLEIMEEEFQNFTENSVKIQKEIFIEMIFPKFFDMKDEDLEKLYESRRFRP